MNETPQPSSGGNGTPIPDLLASRQIFENPWLALREDSLRWPGGVERRYGIVTVQPGVTVLALDEAAEVIWCTRQYRPAIGRVSLELVSGGIESDETPAEAAAREVAEEIGFTAARWDALGPLDGATGNVDSPMHLFLARELSRTPRGGDDLDQLEIEALPRDDVLRRVEDGEITHATSVCAVLKTKRLLGAAWR